MDEPRSIHEPDDRPLARRPYMPTPEQYLASQGDPAPEPSAPMPSPRRRKPRRRRWPKVLAGLLLLVVLAVVGYAAYIAYNVAKISTNPLSLTGLAADETGRTNILVLGVGDPGHAGEKLSDTVMVLSVNGRTKKVAQVSLPRDLRVSIPGYGSNKINVAHALGGVPLAEQTVSDTLNIPIHYYIKTNFSGLKQLVDSVGGIEVDVKERLYDPEYPCDDNQYLSCGLDIQPGVQHMDGTRALQYVRCRKGTCGNDFGRAERQQEVIRLVREKAVRVDVLLDPAKLTPIITAVRGGIETDMGAVQLLELARIWQESAKAGPPATLVLSTSTGGYLRGAIGSSDLLPVGGSFDQIQERVQTMLSE